MKKLNAHDEAAMAAERSRQLAEAKRHAEVGVDVVNGLQTHSKLKYGEVRSSEASGKKSGDL